MQYMRAVGTVVLWLVLALPISVQAIPDYWGGARLNGNRVDFDFSFANDTAGSNIESLLLDGNPVDAKFQSVQSEILPLGVTSTTISGWDSRDVRIDFLPADEFNPSEEYEMIGVKVTGVGQLTLDDLVGMKVTFIYDNAAAATFSFALDSPSSSDLSLQEEEIVMPEPSASLLMGIGLIGLAFYGWRVRKQNLYD